MQEAKIMCKKTIIHIPETKRNFIFQQSLTNSSSNSTVLSSQNPFEALRNQIQDIKPTLELRPEKSGFTRVFLNEEDIIEKEKHQSTILHTTLQDDKYQVDFHKMILLLVKEQTVQQKQQKELSFNTKNILRNICNAQNQYIMFNQCAQKVIESRLRNAQKFKAWVNRLRFHTFEEFQRVWDNNGKKVFVKLYRKLCCQFYKENAIPYIMNSRIKNKQTKLTHIRYLYRFLEGLQNPSDFYYFKQKDKEHS